MTTFSDYGQPKVALMKSSLKLFLQIVKVLGL